MHPDKTKHERAGRNHAVERGQPIDDGLGDIEPWTGEQRERVQRRGICRSRPMYLVAAIGVALRQDHREMAKVHDEHIDRADYHVRGQIDGDRAEIIITRQQPP
jgi:hypothetical protein